MNTEKVIVVLLLIAILFSVVALVINVSADTVVVVSGSGQSVGMKTASVVLNIVKNPTKGVVA